MAKVPLAVSFNGTMDETTELCKYIIPSHHWLESWGDAEPKTGYFSLIQPTINPLFKTRAFQTSLMKWTVEAQLLGSGISNVVERNDYETYFKTYWTAKLGSADLYNKALQDGVVEPASNACWRRRFQRCKISRSGCCSCSMQKAVQLK